MAVAALTLVDMETVCVDGSCDHDEHAGQQLKCTGNGKPLALWEGEELSQKHKCGDEGENACQYRGGLHCMEVVLWVVCPCGEVCEVPNSIDLQPPTPHISAHGVCYPPGIVNGSHQEQHDG